MKNKLFHLIAKVTAVATIASSLSMMVPVRAANLTSASDTQTRLKIGELADHSIQFTSPAGYSFDNDTGTTDRIVYDFSDNWDASGGTWAAADFTFQWGAGTYAIDNVVAAASPSPTSCGGTGVEVVVDTDNNDFTVYPCATFSETGTAAATVIFTIDGTAADGEFANPSSVGTEELSIDWFDELSATASHTADIQIPIVDSDQVTVTANVSPTMTFDIDTGVATNVDSSADYTVDFGTITSTAPKVSGATDSVNHIGIDLSANATGGAVVTIQNANGTNGMVSTSSSPDNIDQGTLSSNVGTITAASDEEGYGFCVVYTNASTGTLDITGNVSGSSYYAHSVGNPLTCASDSETNEYAELTVAPHQFLDSAGAALDVGRAVLVGSAEIDSTTDAHDDYVDTLTFIATGTF
ncbi:hypothetical protein ACFL26_00265 [Patescibacteria group bacterium]